MYWRERRLRPGLYTDGQTVYEASYRYADGRNGMHRKSTLNQFLDSPQVPQKQKDRILQRLDKDTPDLVLEEYGQAAVCAICTDPTSQDYPIGTVDECGMANMQPRYHPRGERTKYKKAPL